MKKTWWITAGVAALLAVGAGGAWKAGLLSPRTPSLAAAKDGAKDDKPLVFTAAEVTRPTKVAMVERLSFTGPLVAPATAVLRAKAGGVLVSMPVREGDRVRAGQVVGRVDLADVTSRVAERDANLASAQAALAQAERTHKSNERLAAQQFISPIALDNSRAALETARAQVQAAQASLQMARVSLREANLVAPIAGIVAKRHVLPGEKVSPEQQVLTIVDLRRLELAGSVGTHEVSRLTPGLEAQVQVEGLSATVTGRIARIAPAADPGTRAIGVTIELPNADERLRAGQYAEATVTIADDTRRLALPDTAVTQSAGQNQVWLIENGVLARRAVTLGRRDAAGGRVEVLTGVTPTSVVLAARFENLREGTQASVAEAAAPASVAGTAAAQKP